jgi:2-dehydro-3-deoxygluconokinase
MRGSSLAESKEKVFDVVCAGEALWDLVGSGDDLSLRPGGGALVVATALAKRGLRVGLATALPDDRAGRALRRAIGRRGVDVGAVTLARPRSGVVLLEAGHVLPFREEDEPAEVPADWTSQVLLLSGLAPGVGYAGALCKAARAARKAGAVVVVDVNARLHLWAGRDGRAIRSLLREADVVRASTSDLAVLGTTVEDVRSAMRARAVFVGDAWALGPFGEVVGDRSGDALVAAMCASIARAGGRLGEDVFVRALVS